MDCALSIIVHCTECLTRMSDLSELIDILDDDEVLHSTDSTTAVGSRTVGIASPIASSSGVPFTGFCCCC